MTVIPIVVGAHGKGLEELEIRARVETIPNSSIIKIGQNTEKSPGVVKRLAVTKTSVKDHQLMLVWKNHNEQ